MMNIQGLASLVEQIVEIVIMRRDVVVVIRDQHREGVY
jgi:hypothetical protein